MVQFLLGILVKKLKSRAAVTQVPPLPLHLVRMLFIGFPLSYQNTCRLFGTPQNDGKILTDAVKKIGLEFEWVDKNVSVLGLRVKEFENFGGSYSSADETIMLIMKYKIKFMELIIQGGLDVSELEIEHMEAEPVLVKNPQPYVVSF